LWRTCFASSSQTPDPGARQLSAYNRCWLGSSIFSPLRASFHSHNGLSTSSPVCQASTVHMPAVQVRMSYFNRFQRPSRALTRQYKKGKRTSRVFHASVLCGPPMPLSAAVHSLGSSLPSVHHLMLQHLQVLLHLHLHLPCCICCFEGSSQTPDPGARQLPTYKRCRLDIPSCMSRRSRSRASIFQDERTIFKFEATCLSPSTATCCAFE